jgi:hypothetical protein
MKKLVSFSLWGGIAKYNVGAIKNAILCGEVYPGWIPRFYVDTTVPDVVLKQLAELGAEVIEKREKGSWRSMFWRFEAASDPSVDIMISRDCDSRLNMRESAAVNEWIESQSMFHILRDHPAHCVPILGGMWGVKAPRLRDMAELIEKFDGGDYWQVDQDFLRAVIYPRVRIEALAHDEFFGGRRFPTSRIGLNFVGQAFDENDECSVEDQNSLAKEMDSWIIRPALRRLQLRWNIIKRSGRN